VNLENLGELSDRTKKHETQIARIEFISGERVT
jgi:hypothetical protein